VNAAADALAGENQIQASEDAAAVVIQIDQPSVNESLTHSKASDQVGFEQTPPPVRDRVAGLDNSTCGYTSAPAGATEKATGTLRDVGETLIKESKYPGATPGVMVRKSGNSSPTCTPQRRSSRHQTATDGLFDDRRGFTVQGDATSGNS
jgi:hypothetical protein